MSGDGQRGQQNPAPSTGGPCSHSTAGHVIAAQLQTGHWQGCAATSMPSGHDGAVHTAVGPQPPAPPERVPPPPPDPALPAAPDVPPVPEGCRDPLSHPAAQTTASVRAPASAPSERFDPPETDVLPSFRPTTRSRMAGF